MSDLDKEEIEATRNMQSSAETAEKTADEMFDDEGMWLEDEDQCSMMRKNDDNKVININKLTREVDCFGYYTQETYPITLNELKAIYKYCKEQGWLDE